MTEFPRLSAEALQRLEGVRAYITAEPHSFDMYTFGDEDGGHTVACIAGHLVLQAGMSLDPDAYVIMQNAASLLGLAVGDASPLFYMSDWPLRASDRVVVESVHCGFESRHPSHKARPRDQAPAYS